jgi:hypothetical protein
LPSRGSILQHRWPASPEYQVLARDWATRVSRTVIDLIWDGAEMLSQEVIDNPNLPRDPVQFERTLVYLLHNRISWIIDKALSFVVVHEPWELESLTTPRARPPQPDLGFVLHGHDRVIWPVEMKVLSPV